MGTSNMFVNAMDSYQQAVPEWLTRNRRAPIRRIRQKSIRRVITVGKLLSSIQPLPSRTILLGRCTDSLPFMIRLGDPEIGAILVSGEAGCGKTHQLQVMVDSALRLNAPHQLQVTVLTHKPDEWQSVLQNPGREKYLRGVHAWYDKRAEQIIQELTDLAEARRSGLRKGSEVLFILDDLNFVENLSYEAQINLHWLLEYGSQSGVWLVGTINACYAESYRYWIDTFRTRIIGTMRSKEAAAIFTRRPDSQVQRLVPGKFQVWTGMDWRKYHLPLLGD